LRRVKKAGRTRERKPKMMGQGDEMFKRRGESLNFTGTGPEVDSTLGIWLKKTRVRKNATIPKPKSLGGQKKGGLYSRKNENKKTHRT